MIHHIRVDLRDSQTATRLASALREDGIVTFDGVAGRASLLRLVTSLLTVWHHRDSDPDGITVIRDRGDIALQPGSAGLGHEELPVHTESSAEPYPPELMLLHCARGATSGGECRLLDGARLYQELANRDPELLYEMSAPRSALFGGAAGHLGSVFAPDTDGRTEIRFRLDELVRFSPQITSRLPFLRNLLAEFQTPVRLKPGGGYLLCNTRWLHGRAGFAGERLMYRVLGNPLSTIDIPAGFLPRQRRFADT